jgi:alkaline phosphatase
VGVANRNVEIRDAAPRPAEIMNESAGARNAAAQAVARFPGRVQAWSSVALLGLLAAGACAPTPFPARDAGDDDGDDVPGWADAGPAADATPGADAADGPDAAPVAKKRRVILMIGDGMGAGQLEAASRYAHGAPGQLFMQSLPVQGVLDTGNLSGITDSAAAATTMATGVRTWNGAVGVDRDGQPVETLVETAQALGLASGIVSTASLPHATPAAFSAHEDARGSYLAIADDQALEVRPDVMLGGGAQFYLPVGPGSLRSDAGLLAPLAQAGYQVVSTAAQLAAASPDVSPRLVGVFAPEHLTYVLDRGLASPEPTLTEMSLAALEFLDRDAEGFFLMIEGARIDMASHGNDAARAVAETLAFDDAVRAVAEWAAGQDDVTLLVTADHECGGLRVVQPAPAGTLSQVAWRWGQHTNALVSIFGRGPGAAPFAAARRDHTWVYAALEAQLTGATLQEPERVLVPDGDLRDLRWLAATQTVPTGFGAGYNQLDALWLDADAHGLAIGVEGLFEWDHNAIVVLVDLDYGAGTGPARLAGALTDQAGRIDAILAASPLDSPRIPGFGADVAIVAHGGADPHLEELVADAGVRGLRPPLGLPGDLGWFGAAINFGDGARTRAGSPPLTVPDELGWEAHVPWATLYPLLAGAVPSGATVAVAVVLVNDDGGYLSNQALPPFAATVTANPGRAVTRLPGIVSFVVDGDEDGVADGDTPPAIVPAP